VVTIWLADFPGNEKMKSLIDYHLFFFCLNQAFAQETFLIEVAIEFILSDAYV